jgi:hypothetical protein
MKLTTHFHLVLGLCIYGAISPRYHVPSWRRAELRTATTSSLLTFSWHFGFASEMSRIRLSAWNPIMLPDNCISFPRLHHKNAGIFSETL